MSNLIIAIIGYIAISLILLVVCMFLDIDADFIISSAGIGFPFLIFFMLLLTI